MKHVCIISTLFITSFLANAESNIQKNENTEFRKNIAIQFPGIPPQDIDQYLKDKGDYKPALELQLNNGSPKGTITKITTVGKKHYSGKEFNVWVYTPPNYNDKLENSVMIFLDGSSYMDAAGKYSFPVPVALDNMITKKEIPPVIGIFIDPAAKGDGLPIYKGKDNRSLEYDSADGIYADFISNEIIPLIKEKYNITNDPACTSIMGASSGGAGAFGVAWHRPDRVGNVITSIGSFVNIRGADSYISRVRQNDKKPIRVYMQDGKNEINTIFGDWTLANEQMASSLKYKGYDYHFEQGEGGHNYYQMASLIGDAFRWVWKDAKTSSTCNF